MNHIAVKSHICIQCDCLLQNVCKLQWQILTLITSVPLWFFLPFKHEWRQHFFLNRGFYWGDLDTEGILLPNTPPLCCVKFHSPPTVPFDVVHPTRALYDVLNCTYTDRLWFYSYDCIVKMRRLPCCLSRVVGLRKIYNVFAIPWIAKQLFQNAMT